MAKMIESKSGDTLPMREFNISNHLLGDRAALDAAFDRDGYWFFRDVLDKDAVARTRAVFLDVLNKLGVIDPSRQDAAVYNGAPLDDFPIKMGGPPDIDPLLARYPRDAFVKEPAVKRFFEALFGDEVFWVPNSEFHAAPPQGQHFWVPESERAGAPSNAGPAASRFNYVHSDGPNNKGLPLKICWIPIAEIDEETGGLAVAEGLHKPRMGDFPRLMTGIKEGDVPKEAWRRALYKPGDLLVFSLETPHSGLGNRSSKYFRLSMDIRGMKKSENIPVVGKVAAIDRCAIAVDDNEGKQHTFRIDEDTYCRIYREKLTGIPLELDEIPRLVKVGAPVYVAADHGTAVFIRPQH